ncbi:hypothetical protein [Acetonema longum]|uniref:Uncharacterized protein n=1 Tax=Acetonema longum DSM 6540 TaxID=1009370 RepID=F7NQ74_9FIRM|nr:hypothetical protein [Acetonema longum]EGO61833.1 hypothetical protein ALO_21374 [Acetonema longum DSM 6540]
MDFSFTLFQPRKERIAKDTPSVTVSPNGRIVFNKKAAELLANQQFCMLGYDQQNHALGILPLSEGNTNSFPVRYAAKGAYIGAKKFFRHFSILPAGALEQSPVQVEQYIAIKM